MYGPRLKSCVGGNCLEEKLFFQHYQLLRNTTGRNTMFR